MAIPFSCPHCSTAYTANEEMAGIPIECPECRKAIVIPALPPVPGATPVTDASVRRWILPALGGIAVGLAIIGLIVGLGWHVVTPEPVSAASGEKSSGAKGSKYRSYPLTYRRYNPVEHDSFRIHDHYGNSITGPLQFDPNNFIRTIAWAADLLEPHRLARRSGFDNQLRKDKRITDAQASITRIIAGAQFAARGKRVTWKIEVERVETDPDVVRLRMRPELLVEFFTAGYRRVQTRDFVAQFREDFAAMLHPSGPTRSLILGEHIPREAAIDLSAGSTVRVEGTVAKLEAIVDPYAQIAQIYVLLDNVVALP